VHGCQRKTELTLILTLLYIFKVKPCKTPPNL
jgi:hypothetical protein